MVAPDTTFTEAAYKFRAAAIKTTPSNKRPAPATLNNSGTSPWITVWAEKQITMFTDVKMVEAAAAGHSCAPALRVPMARITNTNKPNHTAANNPDDVTTASQRGASCTSPTAGKRKLTRPSCNITQAVRTDGLMPCDL